jgi:glycosyltransferase involved in cell wall biosynthesis
VRQPPTAVDAIVDPARVSISNRPPEAMAGAIRSANWQVNEPAGRRPDISRAVSEPLVAVITRTKNRPRFLARAVRSVASQRFDDCVHVIVNDGGEVGAVDSAVKGVTRRVQVVHLPASVGRGAAANQGLARSESTLVVFHDDDDTWQPGFLLKAVAAWRSTGRKGVVTGATQIIERESGNDFVEVRREPFFPQLEAISLADVARESCFVNLAFLAERSAVNAAGGYDESLPLFEDWDFALRFLQRFDVAFLPEPLANYHHREAAEGAAQNSFALEAARVADARAVLLNRWLRAPGPVGTLMALGPTVSAVHGLRERFDKLFNLVHGARQSWPLRTVEAWLNPRR